MRAFLIYFLASSTLLGASQIRFEGYVGSAKDPKFALLDAESGQSRWLSIGDSFAGVTVVDFDKASKTLVVSERNETKRLSLDGATFTDPPKAESGEQWRVLAESRAAKGDAELRELLLDFDAATAEHFGVQVAVNFSKLHPATDVPADEFARRLHLLDRELQVKQETVELIKTKIIQRCEK